MEPIQIARAEFPPKSGTTTVLAQTGAKVLMIENSSTNVTLDTHTKPTRNSLVSLTTLTVFIVAILMLASCATVTEEQKYKRTDRLMAALEEYEIKAAACKAAGATMMITGRATRIESYKHARLDYQRAKCVRLR